MVELISHCNYIKVTILGWYIMMFNDTSGMKIYDNGITKQKIDIHGHNEQPRSSHTKRQKK